LFCSQILAIHLCSQCLLGVLITFLVQDVPGSGKFKKKALQNEDFLREMFGDISNDETDH
jgi:hypothetical protein